MQLDSKQTVSGKSGANQYLHDLTIMRFRLKVSVCQFHC